MAVYQREALREGDENGAGPGTVRFGGTQDASWQPSLAPAAASLTWTDTRALGVMLSRKYSTRC